ncbi:MAG: TonB-dependent receptor [Bermanella sp.]
MSALRTIIFLLSLALACGHLSFANENMSFEELLDTPLAELMHIQVQTASLASEPLSSAPGNIMVISRQQINDRGYRHLKELMQDLPSVDIQSQSSFETENRMTLRGVVGNSKFIILQDGIRISPPTGDAIAISYNYPLYHVKQVEVVYGPASALYGADAFTGVINLISQKGLSSSQTQWTLGAGVDQLRYSSVQYRGAINEDTLFTLGADFHKSDNQDLSKEYPEYFPNNDLVTFGGSTVLNASNRNSYNASTKSHTLNMQIQFKADFQLGYNRRYYEVPTTIIALPDNVNYNTKNHWITQIDTLHSLYSFTFSNAISTDIQLSYSFYELNEQSKFNNILTNYINGYKYARGEETELTQKLNIQLSESSYLIGGYTLERFNYLPATPTVASPYNTNTSSSSQGLYYLGSNNQLPIRTFNTHYTNQAAFTQLKNNWGDQWTSTLGLRYDENSIYGKSVNPRLGAVWQPGNQTSLKILYAQAFLAPSASLIFQHFGGFAFQDSDGVFQSFLMHVPNPDLEPEEMQTFEINLQHQFSPSLVTVLSVYSEKVSGMIAQIETPTVQNDFVPGGNIASTVWNDNIGKLSATGADISFVYKKPAWFTKMELWGNYSWIDGHLTGSEGQVELPFVAKNKVKLGATFKYKQYFFSPSIHWIDSTSGSETGEDIGRTVPEYTLANVYLGTRAFFNSKLELGLRIHNIFNEKYENSNVNDEFEFFGKPQQTRSWQLDMSLKY